MEAFAIIIGLIAFTFFIASASNQEHPETPRQNYTQIKNPTQLDKFKTFKDPKNNIFISDEITYYLRNLEKGVKKEGNELTIQHFYLNEDGAILSWELNNICFELAAYRKGTMPKNPTYYELRMTNTETNESLGWRDLGTDMSYPNRKIQSIINTAFNAYWKHREEIRLATQAEKDNITKRMLDQIEGN